MGILNKSFHIQRGDDVQTAPKNDLVQVFSAQSKSGQIEIIVIADGETGGSGKNQLSQFAVQTILGELKTLVKNNPSLEDCLKQALETTHEKILSKRLNDSEIQNDAVDLLVCILKDNKAFLGNTGKIAAYHVSKGNVEIKTSLTKPNSFGFDQRFFPEVVGPVALNEGDDLLLASDGFFGKNPIGWSLIKKNEIVDALRNESDLKRAAKRLVSYPLGRNVEEDISVVIIRNAKKERKKTSSLLIPALLGVGLLAFVLYRFVVAPKPAVDLGRAVLISADAPVSRVNPADSSSEELQGTGEFPGGYSIDTQNAQQTELIVERATLLLGPGTELLFRQIQVDTSGEENHIVLEVVNTESWVLLDHAVGKAFTFYYGEARIQSGETSTGVIGLAIKDTGVALYCFTGVCLLSMEGVDLEMEPGNKVRLGEDVSTVEPITDEELTEFEAYCPSCSIR